MATKVPQGNPACPSSAPSSFPDKGVSLDFLTQFRDSTKMKQPMHELAGLTRSQIDATELPALRDICKQYRVLATAGMPDPLEFAIYDGKEPKPKEYFVDALCQLPTTMAHVCFCIVKPETKDLNGSYAEQIIEKGPCPEWVGTPTDFCSHTWKSSFEDFVNSLVAEDQERRQIRTDSIPLKESTKQNRHKKNLL